MKVELVESSGAGAALEEIKLIYGSDCLIVASVLKEEKHYTIVAIESEDEHKEILKSEESADGESADGLNLMIKDMADVSELENFGVKVPICTEKVNFRDILHNLPQLKLWRLIVTFRTQNPLISSAA